MVTQMLQPSRQSLAKNNETFQGSRKFYLKMQKSCFLSKKTCKKEPSKSHYLRLKTELFQVPWTGIMA